MKTIKVNSKSRQYEIRIGSGLLENIGDWLFGKGYKNNMVVVTNNVVDKLYGEKIEESLSRKGGKVARLVISDGEEYKTLDTAVQLYKELQRLHADRNTPVIALGGGVIGDLAGFVAATYLRGLPLVHVPTTLLAQFDSSIGGKVAVHLDDIKNMIGSFYNPIGVISDIDTFNTLPEQTIIDGLSEVIKHAVIRDESFFTYLETNIDKIKSLDKTTIEYVVYKSAQIKVDIIKKDERDYGLRNTLNLGHTLGHAIESASGFTISHGRAVAVGMMGAAKIANQLHLFGGSDLKRLENLLVRAGLSVTQPELDVDSIMRAIEYDKKIINGTIRFILPDKIGSVSIYETVSPAMINNVLVHWYG